MSYSQNLLLSQSEIPIKIFVKEKNELISQEESRMKSNLQNFEGTELKKAYEEIISETNDNDRARENPYVSNANIKNYRVNKAKIKKIKNFSEKNVNIIFKAIENGDKNFILQNINFKNINTIDQFGWTPLMASAGAGNIGIVNLLLDLGANKKIKDKSGFTAIDIALKKNHLDIVNLLKFYKKNKISTKRDQEVLDKKKQNAINDHKQAYCKNCKINFTESSKKSHETSILHTFNCNPKVGSFYGIPKANKGYQMLLNSGWNEEGGLGPSGEGQKYPVKTILKRDKKGLGVVEYKRARITHFNANDSSAVKTIKKDKKKKRSMDRNLELKKDALKTRMLRKEIS